MTAVRALAGLLALSAFPGCGGATVPAAAPPPTLPADGDGRGVAVPRGHRPPPAVGVEAELRDAAELRLTPEFVRVGLELRGPLLLERQADDAKVSVVEPGGNILFTIRPPAPARPLGVLAGGQDALDLPMVITATRCDGHALAESKRSYIFAFFTALDGGEPHLTTVTAEPPLQRQLDRLALDTCRPGS
ncbi:MAG: hypothetical protein LH469_08705 [Frankiaceae bacterium]|nr:hypothetical protein [Frankiaceae bacterium]